MLGFVPSAADVVEVGCPASAAVVEAVVPQKPAARLELRLESLSPWMWGSGGAEHLPAASALR